MIPTFSRSFSKTFADYSTRHDLFEFIARREEAFRNKLHSPHEGLTRGVGSLGNNAPPNFRIRDVEHAYPDDLLIAEIEVAFRVREHVVNLSNAREITSDFGPDYAQHIGEQNLLREGCRYASLGEEPFP